MERKLATIARVTNIEPITFINADGVEETAQSIVKAKVRDWNIVTQKTNFNEGDLCVYFEIDSILPREPWSEFLVDVNRPDKPIRIKTIKLKGNIAQGLAMPIENIITNTCSIDHEKGIVYIDLFDKGTTLNEGDDITNLLGVTKYEEPEMNAQLAGIARGNFPPFLKKTDEERIQNCFNKVQPFFKSFPFYVTEKLDGSSFTAYLNNDEFGVCSRNLNLKDTEGNALWKFAREIDLENKLRSIGGNVAIQGELVGPGIQKNKLALPKVKLFLFNIYDIDTGSFYDYINFQVTAQKVLEIDTVPVWEVFPDGLPFESVDDMVTYVTRKSVLNDKIWAEGGVFRTKNEVVIDRFGRMSFKAISPQFLLKYDG